MSECDNVKIKYYLRVFFDDRDGGQRWGPFSSPEAVDAIAVSAASRTDVLRMEVEKEAIVTD